MTSFLLRGGMDAEGKRSLEPAPLAGFSMPEVADGDRSSSFALVLPGGPGGGGDRAGTTLAPPGGSLVLDGDTSRPLRILLDPGTGQVRGILREVSPPDGTALVPRADGDSIDTRSSRGLPEEAACAR